MGFDAVFQGPPANVPSPASAAALGFDEVAGAFYYTSPQSGGWVPTSSASQRAVSLSQTSTNANVLTNTAPATGLYRVSTYTVQATTTNGTLPVPAVAFTEGDLGTSNTVNTVASGTATTGQGQSQSGSVIVNAKAGTTIVISTAAPTTLTYNIKARIESLG